MCRKDIWINQGLDFSSTLIVNQTGDSGNIPIDLSGYNITGELKLYSSNSGISQGFNINILEPTNSGTLTFGLTQTSGLPISQYHYYILGLPPSGIETKLAYGYIYINPL